MKAKVTVCITLKTLTLQKNINPVYRVRMKNEKKITHLGYIQGIINRFCNNSFLIKGWCVTITAALTALSSGSKDHYILIAYFPIIVFWFLDAYYLWQEILYRALYDNIRIKGENTIDFSMKIPKKIRENNNYISVVFSKTIFPFYAVLIGTVLFFMFVFK